MKFLKLYIYIYIYIYIFIVISFDNYVVIVLAI